MNRSKLNFIIDLLLLIVTAGVVYTGLIISFVLKPGFGCRNLHGWTLWGLRRHDYGDIHVCLSIAMIVLCGIHLGLHWKWFCMQLNRLFKLPDNSYIAAISVAGLTAITAGSLFLLNTMVIRN
jgi:hypothetical protein